MVLAFPTRSRVCRCCLANWCDAMGKRGKLTVPQARRSYDVVSLFSGAGGLDIGLERAGWNVVSATDHDSDAIATLRANKLSKLVVRGRRVAHMAKTNIIEADVRDLTPAQLRPRMAGPDWRPDLLVGGPPCQPWSSAGHQKGLNDPRGQLIARMMELIEIMDPRFVLFENVRGLVTARGATGRPGEVLLSIQNDLADMGYASRIATLNAADYGAAQRRVRLLLLATKEHSLPDFPAPTHGKNAAGGVKPWVTLGEVLQSMPKPTKEDVVLPAGPRAAELLALKAGTGIKTGGKIMNNRPSGQWGYRQDSFRADLSLPSRTVRAAATPDWVKLPRQPLRRLTWSECAALQGFPAEWQFAGTVSSKFKQIGNAVQVDVAEVLGESLRDSLKAGEIDEKPVTPGWPDYLVRRVRYTEAEHRVNGDLRVRLKPESP